MIKNQRNLLKDKAGNIHKTNAQLIYKTISKLP